MPDGSPTGTHLATGPSHRGEPVEGAGRVPTVSVCMPVSRDATVVRRALGSVLSQDFDDFEVLVGDETGSAEPAITEAADPRIRYYRNPRRLGFSDNHVALLDRATGRYVTVLHDDDWWEPTYLSTLVAVLDRDPEVGLACCASVLDDDHGHASLWPFPLAAGRHDGVLESLLREEWFLLLNATMWRKQVWTGPAREWPDLCCGDLQLFLSAADAGWSLYYDPAPLAHWAQHADQSGAWRGPDHGLGVADDVLAFWDGWLRERPRAEAALVGGQRARWHLRRARALLLAGRAREARAAVEEAHVLWITSDLDPKEPPGFRRLWVISRLPSVIVRVGVGLKRYASGARARRRN